MTAMTKDELYAQVMTVAFPVDDEVKAYAREVVERHHHQVVEVEGLTGWPAARAAIERDAERLNDEAATRAA